MKLDTIDVFVVGNPPPRHGGRYFIFVKLTTKCGITGNGEIYNATFSPHLCGQMAIEVFERQFLGNDPHHIEQLWHKTYGAGYSRRPDITVMGVLSGLELACWDIVGKVANKPIYELLGGKVRERLRSYTYLYPTDGDVYPDPNTKNIYNDADLAAESALEAVNSGFTAIKFDPAGPYSIYDGRQPTLVDIERIQQFCTRIREAVSTKADMLIGTHGQYTVAGAKRIAKILEPYNPLWFEEPIPPESPEAMAKVANFTSVPIATGERLCTKYEFARILELGAASILQMDLGRVGGILEAKKIAASAEYYTAQIAPHLYCGPIVAAANIQLATCIPNFLILESIRKFDGFYANLLIQPIKWENGYVIPPTEPGLGVILNEEIAKAHPYEDAALHLEMVNNPI